MMPNRFLLRCVAVLSAVSLSDAAVPYHLSMSGMTSTDDYISVFEGVAFGYDVAYGHMQDLEEGRLPKFPCFEDGTLWESYVVNVNIETGLPFYVHQTAPTAEDALEPVEEMLGEWSADVFWGQFEGAKFDPDMTRYSWFRAMDRKFRVVGDGRWCRGGESVPVPTSLEKFGGGKDTAVKINATDLDGIYASLAIRFNYFDMDRDIGHANYSDPSDVRTKVGRSIPLMVRSSTNLASVSASSSRQLRVASRRTATAPTTALIPRPKLWPTSASHPPPCSPQPPPGRRSPRHPPAPHQHQRKTEASTKHMSAPASVRRLAYSSSSSSCSSTSAIAESGSRLPIVNKASRVAYRCPDCRKLSRNLLLYTNHAPQRTRVGQPRRQMVLQGWPIRPAVQPSMAVNRRRRIMSLHRGMKTSMMGHHDGFRRV
jgi:hypothetical protein